MMEEIQTPDRPSKDNNACIKCGNPAILEGYPNPLCYECRESLIRFPVPLWVKLFGAVILVLLIFSLASFPTQLNIGIHLLRGEKASENKNYVTAQREFEKVLKESPASLEANGQMMIAAFYNMDMGRFSEEAGYLQGKNFDDDKLLAKLNVIMDKASSYYPSDSFNKVLETYPPDSIPGDAYVSYINDHNFDVYAITNYASQSFNEQAYSKADSLLSVSHSILPGYMPGILLKVQLKRIFKQYDSALYYCDKALEINHQLPYAQSMKARTLMQQNQLKKGLELSLTNYRLNSGDGYAAATLALAYHLNGKLQERDELMAAGKRDSTMAFYMEYVSSVIDGKEEF